GTVVTRALGDALKAQAVAPDCLFTGSTAQGELRYVHRALDQGDLYFVASGSAEPQSIEASLRLSGQAPEIWRADTAERRPASYRVEGDRTIVPLKLSPHDAVFIVFRQSTTQASRLI